MTYEYNFTYDAAGNRTAWQVVGGSTTYYHHDVANKLMDYGSSNTPPYTGNATVAYDNKGNTTQTVSGAVTTTYTWNYLNRMTRWQKTNETTQDYVYNADGMRVRRTPSGGTATDFMLDGAEIAEEITGSSVMSYVGPGIISQISGSTRTIYHADAIGSTRAMSGDNAVVTEAGVYDAYGNLVVSSGNVPSLGFAGQYRYYADATGLDYLKARYYCPGVGRFLSRDPIGYKGGMNLYAYAENLPTSNIDPLGTESFPFGTDSYSCCLKKCLAMFNPGRLGHGAGWIIVPVVGRLCPKCVLPAIGLIWIYCVETCALPLRAPIRDENGKWWPGQSWEY